LAKTAPVPPDKEWSMEKAQLRTNLVLPGPNEPPRVAPSGLDEIIASFGSIHEYVASDGQLDSRWQVDFLERVSLPFSLRLSWDPSRTITRMTCHRRLTSVFSSVFNNIQQSRLQDRITTFGGCLFFVPSAPAVNCRPTVGQLRLISIRRAIRRGQRETWLKISFWSLVLGSQI
jgi:hypothetical protein